ncbi:hypothetical protein N7533_010933 [Penicillium manginii]|uniref:uncharacterized protein n=1 Tax=Penicillium manginii TaxID=203109 RepID=UPI00254898DC|nr:uncharacterized protein N7533_010933 [Penicillium manginii]KAJ5741524.1 hypothetical protein N7533_010933 [Penicillium manginii]
MEVNRDPEKAMYRASSLGKPSGRSSSPMADPIVSSSAEQSNDESGQKTGPRDIAQWPITPDVLQIRQRNESNGGKSKKLGVTWQNLTVKGISSDALYNENVLSQINPFGKGRKSPPLKTIIDNSSGCVKPGEMLLVLGNPGAGCTTLLSVLSNHRNGFAEITGDVSFGSMTSQEAKQYRGQIIMNTEEEIFFPALSVGDTINFATRLKVPFHLPPDIKNEEEYAQIYKEFLLKSLGITHTKDTKVGDEFIRGVSGGERKRVSILECLATRGSVFSWDNSTRGLDASTALDWTKAMRAMTDILGLTTIASLYQAGNRIYEQFDKILILDSGKQIFYGPRDEAVPYMEDLGFLCDPAANKSDFLTSVSVPAEAQDKHKNLPKKAAESAGYFHQVHTATIRQFQILWGDKKTLFIKQASTIVQALIGGSLFYNAPDNTAGLFIKGGSLFFSLLYPTFIALAEVTDSFVGRPILAKHRDFALHHPSAFVFAQVITDMPIMLFQISHFGIVLYFMTGFQYTAQAFFIFWLINLISALAMTQLFKLIGAAFPNFDAATKASGFTIVAAFTYAGYMIPKPDMHPWFVWFFWINPMAYAFEALLANEFHDQVIPCVGPFLVPNGEGYSPETGGGQACTGVRGAPPGAISVTGDQYLASMSFSHSNLWRNFGILCAWYVFFVAMTVFFTSRWKQRGEGGRGLLIPREKQKNVSKALAADEESQAVKKPSENSGSDSENSDATIDYQLVNNTSVFTWKNLTYTVKTPHGDRVLLDNVQGFVKPGTLGALMGSSGAGKTTLLDVLAQRKTDGTIHGSVLVDGRPLPVSFQRSAGYVEQMDVHEPLSTVREALEFSALLRQNREIPRKEKLRYVDMIVKLLQLEDLEHTLIGRPGAGLSVEQRKRLTIGVELVAKPSILIFLDEPTSGLDGQAANNTVRFLRKLAGVGQAVLVTIHQPSAELFAQFDTLLLLAKGGKTVYFGDIGHHARTVNKYFADHGAQCPREANPAEHMIEVVSGSLSKGKDWNQVWLNSPEHEKITQELDTLVADAAAQPPGTVDDGHQFAAPMWEQVKLVTHRMNISLFRNTEYINNKLILHILLSLYNGFSFWSIGNSVSDLQQRLFTVFSFLFVAPGLISQLQPIFIDRRNVYETREKKSKTYHWVPFVTGLIVSELPYLVVCGALYFVCWYWTAGLPNDTKWAGSTFFVAMFYEMLYTGIGQSIAAYAPNATFASLVNPLVITTLVSFCGVFVPYSQITPFWRYWLYYLDPFNYLFGAFLTFTTFSVDITCERGELAVFNPPANETCGDYLSAYQQGMGRGTNLLNPGATENCEVCRYTTGHDYLKTLNLNEEYYGWRNAGLVVLWAGVFYALVFLMMKLRTKATKRAST